MQPHPRYERAATMVLWTFLAGLIGLYVVVFALTAIGRLIRPLDEFTYGESWLLDGARRVAHGQLLYAPADQLPLMHIAYTPVYYAVVGWLLAAFGDHGYTTGRLVSLLATCVAAAGLLWSVRSISRCWTVGALAAGVFLTQNVTVLLWAPLHRVDPLALAFTLCGLALASAGRVYLAALLFALAVLTKQTFVVAPVAVLISLWPCRGRMLRFGALYAVICGAAIVGLQLQSGGWFLWHTITGNGNEADLDTFATLLGSFLQFNGLPVLAALATLLFPGGRGERLWRLYFLCCLATLPTIAKLGASSNYWLELTAATAVLLALGAHRLARSAANGLSLIGPITICGALLVGVPAYQAATVEALDSLRDAVRPPTVRYISLVADTGTAPYRVDMRFVEQIAREPGELLTDNSGLAVAAGKPISFEFQIFQLLHVEGHWPERPIVDAIGQRRFALVVLMHPLDGPIDGTRLTPAVRDALRAAYAPIEPQAGFWLYRPR